MADLPAICLFADWASEPGRRSGPRYPLWARRWERWTRRLLGMNCCEGMEKGIFQGKPQTMSNADPTKSLTVPGPSVTGPLGQPRVDGIQQALLLRCAWSLAGRPGSWHKLWCPYPGLGGNHEVRRPQAANDLLWLPSFLIFTNVFSCLVERLNNNDCNELNHVPALPAQAPRGLM